MHLPKLKLGDPILITWDDAFVSHEHYWTTAKELGEIKEIHTLGHYVSKSRRFINVAQSYGNGDKNELDGLGGVFSVPLGCVKSIHKLVKGKP